MFGAILSFAGLENIASMIGLKYLYASLNYYTNLAKDLIVPYISKSLIMHQLTGILECEMATFQTAYDSCVTR